MICPLCSLVNSLQGGGDKITQQSGLAAAAQQESQHKHS
jgi:hypothetical protein